MHMHTVILHATPAARKVKVVMKFHYRLGLVFLAFILLVVYLSRRVKDLSNDKIFYVDATDKKLTKRPSEKPVSSVVSQSKTIHQNNATTQESGVTVAPSPEDKNIHILVHARMRTGSSVTGGLFNNLQDFFYVYEPGHMIVEEKHLDLYADSFKSLETIRPDLVSFLHSIYNCSFRGKSFYTRSLNRHKFMHLNSKALAGVSPPIREEDLIRICRQKKHVVVKTVRLNNIALAESALKEHDVRVIHVVRDPRAMMLSRGNMQRLISSSRKKNQDVIDNRLEKIITDYCKWLEDNYLSVDRGPEWMRKQYLLVRYEDLVDRPLTFVTKLFKFVGLSLDDETRGRIESDDWWQGHGEKWRTHAAFEAAVRVQELCPSVFQLFGYANVSSEDELTDRRKSLVVPLEKTELNPRLVG